MSIKEALKEWQLNSGASEDAIDITARLLNCALPSDYLNFLRSQNGGEGFIGNNYLILWKVEELAPFNQEYEVEKYAPGIILFGSNGGGEGFGFDTNKETMPIVQIPFIGMDLRYAMVMGERFIDFLNQLEK